MTHPVVIGGYLFLAPSLCGKLEYLLVHGDKGGVVESVERGLKFSFDILQNKSIFDMVQVVSEKVLLVLLDDGCQKLVDELDIVVDHDDTVCLIDRLCDGTQKAIIAFLKAVLLKDR